MISINTFKQANRSGRIISCARAVISVANSDIRLPQWCHEVTGVGYVITATKRTDLKWKQVYRWDCANKKAVDVIAAICPYLLLKRSQAEVVMAFQKLIVPRALGRYGVGPENLAQRLSLVTEIRSLNRRGKEVAA